jgi:hypothetical protein
VVSNLEVAGLGGWFGETYSRRHWPSNLGQFLNAEAHEAGVDEVEFQVIGPLFFDVINFEFDVWRKP